MDTDGVRIRTVRTEDVPAFLEAWSSSRSTAADVEDTERDWSLLLDYDPEAVVVVIADEHIVGTVVATWDGWRGGMHRLVVLPPYRRLGISRALVEAAHQRLAARGAKRINILVAEIDEGVGELWAAMNPRRHARLAQLPGFALTVGQLFKR